jgi:hypothetical protein
MLGTESRLTGEGSEERIPVQAEVGLRDLEVAARDPGAHHLLVPPVHDRELAGHGGDEEQASFRREDHIGAEHAGRACETAEVLVFSAWFRW